MDPKTKTRKLPHRGVAAGIEQPLTAAAHEPDHDADELSDDELSDDELSDDELSDDELSDDELSDDELSDEMPGDDVALGEEIDAEEAVDRIARGVMGNQRKREDLTRRRQERIDAAHAKGCAICIHAAEHAWLGPQCETRSHCGKCCRGWNSLREAHCPICCRHFASDAAASAHDTRDGCTDPATMTRRDGRPRFRTRTGPLGTTWTLAFYGERPEHWKS